MAHTYPYAARCESRGEFVYVSRSAVKGIIDRFSPWLAQRFEYFRQAVLDNIRKVEEGKQVQETSIVGSPEITNDTAEEERRIDPMSSETKAVTYMEMVE